MMTQEASIRLAMVCPPLIACGLTKMLHDSNRLEVVPEISSLNGLQRLLDSSKAQITLIDWDLVALAPGMGEVLRMARSSSRLLFLMQALNPNDCRAAFEMGARGIVAKDSSTSTIRGAVWEVLRGGTWMGDKATNTTHAPSLASRPFRDRVGDKLKWLTRREREVVEMVCRGYRNKQIANELGIAETTVWHHLTSIFRKVEVDDRMSLIVFAHRNAPHMVARQEVAHGSEPANAVMLSRSASVHVGQYHGLDQSFLGPYASAS
jgi:DNA-binding NarL/FixJ family response regulator